MTHIIDSKSTYLWKPHVIFWAYIVFGFLMLFKSGPIRWLENFRIDNLT